MKIARPAYNRIRPYLPQKIGVWAGVAVRSEGLFDFQDQHPDYKKGLIDAIHEYVRDGDAVTLVGAGRGVSTVHCLRAGADRVVAYEAAEEMLAVARETVDLEGATDRVDWRHALVGEEIEVYGDLAGAETVPPNRMEIGDVLVLDCEGAERSILEGMDPLPRRVIVETHPERGVETVVSRELLTAAGYDVTARRYEPDQRVDEKRVLVGVRDE